MSMLNLQMLRDVTDGNEELIRELLEAMLRSLDENIPRMQQAAQTADAEELKQAAHKLRSGIAYLNYTPLTEKLGQAEITAAAIAPAEQQALVTEVTEVALQVYQAVQEALA